MLKIGLIGAGRMGNAHSENLAQLKNVSLYSVYDIDPEKSKAYAAKYPSVKICASAAEVVNDPEVGLVVIASPTYCHPAALKLVIAANKPVFCEKPLCRSEKDYFELKPMLENYKNFFAVGFVRRYSGKCMTMQKLIREGKIGRIIAASVVCTFGGFKRDWDDWFADYEKSGGVMLDMLAHHCDLLNDMLGVPENVYARALMLNKAETKPFDYVSATATYKSGVVANLECSWLRSGPSETYMVVYGDKASIKFSDSEGVLFYEPGKAPVKMADDEGLVGNLQEKISGGMYADEIAFVVDAVLNGKKPLAGVKEAINAMKFGFAMIRSSENGKLERTEI